MQPQKELDIGGSEQFLSCVEAEPAVSPAEVLPRFVFTEELSPDKASIKRWQNSSISGSIDSSGIR